MHRTDSFSKRRPVSLCDGFGTKLCLNHTTSQFKKEKHPNGRSETFWAPMGQNGWSKWSLSDCTLKNCNKTLCKHLIF